MKKKILICFLSIFLSNADGQIIDPHGEHHEEPSYLKEELFCNHSNYKEFIFDPDKMLELRDQGKTCQLGGREFANEDFSGAILVGVNFRDSEFWLVKFDGANLFDADMTDIECSYSDFSNTTLMKTDFTDAQFSSCKFRGAKMMESIFIGTYLSDVELHGANVTDVNFTNVLFSGLEVMGLDSVVGLDKIICSPRGTGDCKVLRDCSKPDNPYC